MVAPHSYPDCIEMQEAMASPHSYPDCIEMQEAVKSVEEILRYKFKNKKFLEMALTHSSCTNSVPYQRLEFVGDAALGLAIASYVYLTYPKHDPCDLSLVKSANVSTEKLARVAVGSGLYKYVRHNAATLKDKIKKFVKVVQAEENVVIYGGAMKAPKILADIVESVVAAVYVDLQFDLKATWLVVKGLLEPLITLDMLKKQPQPISKLYDSCQKNGEQVDIKQLREGDMTTASVYIDNKLISSVSSGEKENARLHAAMAALEKSTDSNVKMDINSSLIEKCKTGAAKRKLEEISVKKRWAKPIYSPVKELGPPHAKIFVYSVSLKIDDDLFYEEGEENSRLKDAQGSAALTMLLRLQEKNLL